MFNPASGTQTTTASFEPDSRINHTLSICNFHETDDVILDPV